MVPSKKPSLKMLTFDLIAQAELSFGFVRGKGLGAVLLALLALVFLTLPESSIGTIVVAAREYIQASR